MTNEALKSAKTIEWTGTDVKLLDQTLLPDRVKYLAIRTEEEMWEAIKMLRVRGAPAIGVAAAYGLYLGTYRKKPRSLDETRLLAKEAADYLATSRPTAVNLFWALAQGLDALEALPPGTKVADALEALLRKAIELQRDDEERCRRIAANGAPLLEGAKGVLTHCNAGALATAGIGTALGVIWEAARLGGQFTVYVDETRPLLQGARLTAWELKNAGIEHRLITDSMAASAMQRGLVQAIVAGADRIAANGDTANKIGTMPLAICASFYKVPFYIAAPLSTVDFSLATGAEIPIEERTDHEITHLGEKAIAPKGTMTFNPAFDVVPNDLITAIITETGVVRPPFAEGLKRSKRA